MTKTTLSTLPDHSKLGASSYERWKACPGSIRMSEGLPNESSIYAEEGSLAHSIAERILLGLAVTEKDWVLKSGKRYPEEQREELMDAVTTYINHVELLRQKQGIEAVECKFHLATYHPDLFGTSDYWRYVPSEKTLYVTDYKHGAGVEVDVEGNLQARYYGLGALDVIKKPVDKVVITIVQPRCYSANGSIRSEVVDSVELVEFGFQLVEDALATQKPDAPIVPGDHCRWCPANAALVCQGPQQYALMAAQSAFPELLPSEEVQGLNAPTPGRVAEYLSMIPRVEAWVAAVSQYAHNMAEKGHSIPGFSLVSKVARRKWAADVTAAQLAKTLDMMPEKFTEEKLKSPAQVEKLIGKDKEKMFVLDQLVVKESSGKVLAPDVVKVKSASAIDKMFK